MHLQRAAHLIASSFEPRVNHPIAFEDLALVKGPVRHQGLPSEKRDARAHRRRVETIKSKQRPALSKDPLYFIIAATALASGMGIISTTLTLNDSRP